MLKNGNVNHCDRDVILDGQTDTSANSSKNQLRSSSNQSL